MTFQDGSDAILTVIRQGYQGLVSDVANDDWPILDAIARDTAHYAFSLANGGPNNAETSLAHVEAQIELLAAKVAIRENRHIQETLLRIAKIAAQTLAAVILKMPLA